MWDAARCPPAGRRPREGDVIATMPDGTQIRPMIETFEARRREEHCTQGLGVDFVIDLPAEGELVERFVRACQLRGRAPA